MAGGQGRSARGNAQARTRGRAGTTRLVRDGVAAKIEVAVLGHRRRCRVGSHASTLGRPTDIGGRRRSSGDQLRAGRPRSLSDEQVRYATHLRDTEGLTIPQITDRLAVSQATLHRHLPPRPTVAPTADV